MISSRIRPHLNLRIRYRKMDSISDWERPISQEELEEIDAALESATSLIKRSRSPCRDDDTVRPTVRRLPNWGTQKCSCVNSFVGSPNPLTGSSSNPRNPLSNLRCYSHQVKQVVYPSMTFGGSITYSRTVSEVEKASKELLEIIEAKKKSVDQVSLGFDIEWKPSFVKGATIGKAAVMQICPDAGHCYVIHIHHSGIPPVLQSLLEDPTSVKVGVGITGDAIKIFKDYNVCVKALGDLSDLANKKLGGIPKMWSLKSLAETLTCKQIKKTWNIRLGNWEANILSKVQLQYAALDAFASWYLYEILSSLPDADSSENVAQVTGLSLS